MKQQANQLNYSWKIQKATQTKEEDKENKLEQTNERKQKEEKRMKDQNESE
jgi:hypothetical protein